MFKFFNKTFFHFLVGFVVIIVASFFLIVSASAYGTSGNSGALGQVGILLYNVFIR